MSAMKKAKKSLSVALVFAVLAMVLTCTYAAIAGYTILENNVAASGFALDDTILTDAFRLYDLETLRANAKNRTDEEHQASNAGQAEEASVIAGSTFKLPAALQYIDDEAFEGTALVNVEIPENVEYIGERAFSDIPTLHKVNIPEKTTTIAKSAFAGSNQVTITGVPGSYARKYARENGIPFAPLTVMYANAEADSGVSLNQARTSDEVTDTEEDDGPNDNEPAGRIAGEIKASITENGAAYHIAGRAPPANA